MVPSEERLTELPDRSPADSPSISSPNFVQLSFAYWYILTWPLPSPFPSFPVAPIATMVPSEERLTDRPDISPSASPSISPPIFVQLSFTYWYILTWPLSSPFPSLEIAPIATTEPSSERLTEKPDRSPSASPAILSPICVQVPFTFW